MARETSRLKRVSTGIAKALLSVAKEPAVDLGTPHFPTEKPRAARLRRLPSEADTTKFFAYHR